MSDQPPKLNPAAKSFNPNAKAFVPNFGPKVASPTTTTSAPAATTITTTTTTITTTTTTTPATDSKKVDEVTNKVSHLDLRGEEDEDDIVDDEEDKQAKLEKLKSLDLREHVNIVFIGHVDAGKSTLSGQILYLNGQVDERTMEKYEREAKEKGMDGWAVAYIMDNCEEEKEKGKTVEVGRAFFETAKKRYTILDAPGHARYVPNMIGGASQADIAVLVISAKRGEFESGFDKGGQTREHAMLAKTLGVSFLLVAINKMDEQSVKWDEKRYSEIQEKLNAFLKTVGYAKNQIKYVPIDGLSGLNIMKRLPDEKCPWWKGESFVEALDAVEPIPRDFDGPIRMPIIDKFKDRGVTVVIGKVEAGTITVGSKLLLMPNKTKVEVIGIKLHEVDTAVVKAGENCQIYLKGVEDSDISQGFVLSDAEKPVPVVQEFFGQFVVLDKPMFTNGFSAILHVHTAIEEVTITTIQHILDKKTGQKLPHKPQFAKAGDVVYARMKLSKPICMEKFESCAQLGRFTIRETKTIMVGKVMLIKPM